MCGIVGLLTTDGSPAPRGILERMTAALAHRGPDGGAVQLFGAAGLGHRRLAIIDLEGGWQPLSNEDGKVWIAFNGELYNYRELRSLLEAAGHHFRTNSDTEVIVHAYEQWGKACVERFRGMFAFGIVDLHRRQLFLARDQLGIKPLYYLQSPEQFAFASELQALRQVPGPTWDIDLRAIAQYLRLQYIPAPHTVFQGVCKLPPAHRMTIGFDGTVSAPEEYWKVEFRPNRRRSRAEWLDALDDVLRDSVRAHLVADVPFGAFLSGGVDSSAVVAYMSDLLQQPVRTFTIGFDEEEFSEVPWAEQASRRCGTEHHVDIVRPDALAILPDLVRCYGEPFGDSSAVPTYYVSQLARSMVPMVLSGDGGDEAFAGYGTYRSWMYQVVRRPLKAWKRLLRPLASRLLPGRYPRIEPSLDHWLPIISYLPPQQQETLWRPEYCQLSDEPVEVLEQAFARTRGYAPCSIVQYLDLKTYLPFDILTKVDVASMMHGLEVRTPLVDVRVVEFAATIPESVSMAQNPDGAWEGKRLLRDLLRRRFPSEFLDRRKMGFSMPVATWFGRGGTLQPALQERLMHPSSRLHEWFQPAGIQRLLDENQFGPVWLLLFLDEWLRQNSQCAPAACTKAAA